MGSMHHYIMPPSALCPLRIKCARGYVIYIYSASSLTKHDTVLLPHQNGISTLIMTSMHTAYCQKRLLVPIQFVLLHLSARNNCYCWRKKKIQQESSSHTGQEATRINCDEGFAAPDHWCQVKNHNLSVNRADQGGKSMYLNDTTLILVTSQSQLGCTYRMKVKSWLRE